MDTTLTVHQAVETLQDRADTYSLLSQMYREEICVPVLAGLVEQLMFDDATHLGSEGYALLRQFAARTHTSEPDQTVVELSVEFMRLFLSGRAGFVSPFESVYTSDERVLMQKARDQVLAFYRDEGLDRVAEFREPEDHIAIELDFMAHLCRRAAELWDSEPEAARGYLEKQKAFLDQHLLVWVPRFCADLDRAARSDFYRAISLITQEHLAHELQTVDDLLAALPAVEGV